MLKITFLVQSSEGLADRLFFFFLSFATFEIGKDEDSSN